MGAAIPEPPQKAHLPVPRRVQGRWRASPHVWGGSRTAVGGEMTPGIDARHVIAALPTGSDPTSHARTREITAARRGVALVRPCAGNCTRSGRRRRDRGSRRPVDSSASRSRFWRPPPRELRNRPSTAVTMNRPHDSHENTSLARARSEASRIPASVLPDTTITRPGNHQHGGQPAELAHSFRKGPSKGHRRPHPRTRWWRRHESCPAFHREDPPRAAARRCAA